MSATSARAFDKAHYGSLFAHGVARVITTDEENQAAIQELEAYSFGDDLSPDDLSPEEDAYCEVLTALIQNYEHRFRLEVALQPIETLKVLMSNRNLKQADLVPAIDTKGHVSEILNGNRDLSKAHIQKLSQFFHVSPEVFFPLPASK